jgi:hypothetical protein
VPDAGRGRRVEQVGDRAQLGEVADGANQLDVLLPVDERQSRRVIAAILESLEPCE